MKFGLDKIFQGHIVNSPDNRSGNKANPFLGKEDFILAVMNGTNNDKTRAVINTLILNYRDAKSSTTQEEIVTDLINIMIDSGRLAQKDLNKLQKFITSTVGHQFNSRKKEPTLITKEYLPQELPELEITDLVTLTEAEKLNAINHIARVNKNIATLENLSSDNGEIVRANYELFPPDGKRGGIRDIILALEKINKRCNSVKINHLISRYSTFAEQKEKLNNLKGAI